LLVVFEGVIGSGYTSDMAIDDITTLPGPCPYPGNSMILCVIIKFLIN